MRILVTAPKLGVVQTGNRCTALQWAAILESLGHETSLTDSPDGDGFAKAGMLVALHALKSRGAIQEFRKRNPDGLIVLALTGTDIYPEPDEAARSSMELADALVVLQSRAIERIPVSLRRKARVIVQSEKRHTHTAAAGEKGVDPFLVCVAGHLRDVKDPLRTAEAARLLPAGSKIRIEHAGAVLDSKYHALVEREQRENPRYKFLGELSAEDLRELMRRSQATVLSSFAEGGARVVGESIVEGTPVLATRIDGVTGLIGDDYPGLFEPGNTAELAALLERLETDAAFRESLRRGVEDLAQTQMFDPAREREAWRSLIEGLAR